MTVRPGRGPGGPSSRRGPEGDRPNRADRPRGARVAGRPAGAGHQGRGARGLASARARFESRAEQVRRRPWRLAAGAGAVVLVGLALLWLVLLSPVLDARTVVVTGLTDPAERAAVSAAAAVPIGTPLARVDTSGAADRVGRIVTVAGVEVQRTWPHTVTVRVSRREPVLAVRLPDNRMQLVDADGQPFQTVATAPPGVPLVTSSSTTPAPEGLKAAASVLTLLPPDLRRTVSGVTVTSADLVTFTLGGVTVRWGGLADGPKKLAVLRALLPTSPTTIDVSVPDTPTTT